MGKQAHTAQDRKRALVREAKALGFDTVGVSQAGFLEEEADRLEEWLRRDYHGEMAYLARNVDTRLDPRKLVPGPNPSYPCCTITTPKLKRRIRKRRVCAMREDRTTTTS